MCRLEMGERRGVSQEENKKKKMPRTEHCVRLESVVDEGELWAFVGLEQKRRQRRMRVMSRVPSRSLKLDFDIAILMTCGDKRESRWNLARESRISCGPYDLYVLRYLVIHPAYEQNPRSISGFSDRQPPKFRISHPIIVPFL